MKYYKRLLLILCMICSVSYIQAQGWKIDYLRDEFGDPTSTPYVYNWWKGQRDGGSIGDCALTMRVSQSYGIEMYVMYNGEPEDMAGLMLSAKFNGKVISLTPIVNDNNNIQLSADSERKFYNCMVSKGTLKLSFRTEAYGLYHNRVFTIQCPNGLYTALKGIGLMFR